MAIKKKLKYEQKIIRAQTPNGAWKKLRLWLKKQGKTLKQTGEGKAVKIKPYTYKIYYKSQPRKTKNMQITSTQTGRRKVTCKDCGAVNIIEGYQDEWGTDSRCEECGHWLGVYK